MTSAAASKVDQLPVRAARPAISIDGNRQTELEARLVRYALTDRLSVRPRATYTRNDSKFALYSYDRFTASVSLRIEY